MRSIFNPWPPDPPDWDDYPCDVCGEEIEKCECPECSICGIIGDPFCYKHHGLKRTEEQRFSMYCNEIEWERENRYYWEEMGMIEDDLWESL